MPKTVADALVAKLREQGFTWPKIAQIADELRLAAAEQLPVTPAMARAMRAIRPRPRTARLYEHMTPAEFAAAIAGDGASIPEALEARRLQLGWTASAFSAALGMRAGHYSEVVHGKRRLPLGAIRNAYRMGVPVDILMGAEK